MGDSTIDRNRLSIQRIAGGSVIDNPALFSDDGEFLFIIRRNTVRVYSSNTGEWIRDLVTSTDAAIVNIQNMPNDPTTLVGCTLHGDIVRWDHKSGRSTVTKIQFENMDIRVATFNIFAMNTVYLTWTYVGGHFRNGIFDLNSSVPLKIDILRLECGEPKVAVSRNKHNTIAVIQNYKLFVSNTRRCRTWYNAEKKHFTAIACHPVDEAVAVADVTGKIFIYYNLYDGNNPTNTLYHWHHNPVESIAFTSSGSLFYSGGYERVLLGWNYKNVNAPNVKPRLDGTILHIVVSSDNQKIAVSTDDNGIMVTDPQFNIISTIQSFVRVADDKTPWPKFPLGLKVDPRTNYLALNGRIGQMQFYSPYDGSFFNLDVTMENRLSMEYEKILYNTRITHAACNEDWLVTAECLDDLERFPEVRLKFWKVVNNKYILNTQFESPHKGGLTALEFSRSSNDDNLLCASSGLDRKVKVWSLEESETVSASPSDMINGETSTSCGTKKHWVHLETTSYKNLAVNSLAFSQDGSLLAVGFGNTLCIYTPETLRLKRELSAPCGQDGSTNKVIVNLPETSNGSTMAVDEQDRIRKLLKDYLENGDDKLLNELIKQRENSRTQNQNNRTRATTPLCQITSDEKKIIFERILAQTELNFYQKLQLFQKTNIHICLPADLEKRFHDYIADTMSLERKEHSLAERSKHLGENTKFTGHWKLQNYLARSSGARVNGLHLRNVTFGKGDDKNVKMDTHQAIDDNPEFAPNPIRKVAQIDHVVFCTGDCSHFVIACTKNRLLIWNLLTFKFHAALKVSVNQIAVDPYTSLVAVFTVFNELHVFQPSLLYTLYRRKDMPKIEGAVWLPRRYPKQQSLDVDWQAVSQLFFLNRKQELQYLVADNDEDLLTSKGASLKEVNELVPRTYFGAVKATQITNDTAPQSGKTAGRLFIGARELIKLLIALQTHTMGPIQLYSYDFLTSLSSQNNSLRSSSTVSDQTNGTSVESESEKSSVNSDKVVDRTKSSRREHMVNELPKQRIENTNQKNLKLKELTIQAKQATNFKISF